MFAPNPVQVLPSGLVVPPLGYLVVLGVSATATAGTVYRRRPAITRDLIVAFAPWMVAGAALHALYQRGGAPDVVMPFLSAPAVYVTTFVVASAVWLGTMGSDSSEMTRYLGGVGLGAALVASGSVLATGIGRATFRPLLPLVGLILAVLVSAGLFALIRYVRPVTAARTGRLGALVVFGHALDGISTAIGVDLLGAGERSPIPRMIMDFADGLPTAAAIGSGWLFVFVKLAIAVGVLFLFADVIEDEPQQANVLLGFIAAVGLGPGAHNILLFAVTTGP